MDPIVGSLLFAGGSSLLGGLGNWINGNQNRKAQSQANSLNYAAQKEFYQNSVNWRVADSKRAGVNPIYGLGADSASFSPSFQAVGNNGVGDALSSVSQAGLAMSQILAQSAMMKAQTRMYNAEAALKEKQTSELGKQPVSNTLDPSAAISVSAAPVKKMADGDFANRFSGHISKHFAIKAVTPNMVKLSPTSQTARDNQTEIIGMIGAYGQRALDIYGIPTEFVEDGYRYTYNATKTWLSKELTYDVQKIPNTKDMPKFMRELVEQNDSYVKDNLTLPGAWSKD